MPITRRNFMKLAVLLPEAPGYITSIGDNKWAGMGNYKSPNILLLLFDALSATNISLLGYKRQTTPNLARFADKAIVYNAHYSAGNFTTPGTASLLTGTYPWTHRAIHLHGTIDEHLVHRNIFSQFAASHYTRIAYSHNLLVMSLLWQFRKDLEILKATRDLCLSDLEFADLAFMNDFNVAFWSEWLTLRGGKIGPGSLFLSTFQRLLRNVQKKKAGQRYGQSFPKGIPNLHNMLFILEDAIDWIAEQLVSTPEPYLIYTHLLPPHEPYTPRKEYIDIFNDGWSPPAKPAKFYSQGHSEESLRMERQEYDEYLAYADAEFGRLLDFMKRKNILDNCYVIVTSDHGELFERGIRGHITETLYEPVIRVPLLISQPGQTEREDIFTPTSSIDVLPTLLHITGKPIPDWCEGKVLSPFNSLNNGDRDIFIHESKGSSKNKPMQRSTIALIKDHYKIIKYSGYKKNIQEYEFYDLAKDPDERDELSQSSSAVFKELKNIINEKVTAVSHISNNS